MKVLFCLTALQIATKVRRISAILACAATLFVSPVQALKAEDGVGYAHRICSLFEAVMGREA
jgi:hypothetical protein